MRKIREDVEGIVARLWRFVEFSLTKQKVGQILMLQRG